MPVLQQPCRPNESYYEGSMAVAGARGTETRKEQRILEDKSLLEDTIGQRVVELALIRHLSPGRIYAESSRWTFTGKATTQIKACEHSVLGSLVDSGGSRQLVTLDSRFFKPCLT